jgi:hypothetical protein
MSFRILIQLLGIALFVGACTGNPSQPIYNPLTGKSCRNDNDTVWKDLCVEKERVNEYFTQTAAAAPKTVLPSTATPTKTTIPTPVATNTVPATLTTAPSMTPVPTTIPPTRTAIPADTSTPIPADTATPLPTDTITVLPTDTLVPTEIPTATEVPSATSKPSNKVPNAPRPTESGYVTPTR